LPETVIKITDLSKSYGKFEAVKGISFEIFRGEIFSILGHNGAGKTTTLEIIEGQRTRTSGTVQVLGMDPETKRAEISQRVGILPQDFNFLELINCGEAVDFYIKSLNAKDSVDGILERVDLLDKKRSLIKNLSGGEKHKLGLGLALVNDPEILFLDEPTTGLDPVARRSVWKVIERLKGSGKSIILTTHYLEEAQKLADRVCIMDRGMITITATPDEIIHKYGKGSVLRLSFSDPDMKAFLKLGMKHRRSGDFIEIDISTMDEFFSIIDRFKEIKISPENLTLTRDTLEDIFIDLMGADGNES
jgi:ABC-2 type transport system ATP-binding protein